MAVINLSIKSSFFEEEVRDGYLVSSAMKKVWAVELDLLNEFSKVCEKHNLRWFVHAGTLLGAIRHHGFIPWDDDIDIVMPRSDFEELNKIGPDCFEHPYFYQTEATDTFFSRNYARLRNSETTAILGWEMKYQFPYNQGIFIDIFPIDSIPDNTAERERYFKNLDALNNKAWQLRNMVYFYQPKTDKGWVKRNNYFVKHLYYKYIAKQKGDYRLYLQLHYNLVTKYNKMSTKCAGELVIAPLGRWIWNREWIVDVKLVPFEMLMVPVPVGYEECLKSGFGESWSVPKQVPTMHGKVIFDVDKSYIEYLKNQ